MVKSVSLSIDCSFDKKNKVECPSPSASSTSSFPYIFHPVIACGYSASLPDGHTDEQMSQWSLSCVQT
jgi:hypothetical protein